MKLAIIEDNHELREILSEHFKKICQTVADFESIEAFKKKYNAESFFNLDAAIIDINLPGQSGIDFIKGFKEESEIPSLFVITGESFVETNFDELPDIYIFLKPLNMDILTSSVIAARRD